MKTKIGLMMALLSAFAWSTQAVEIIANNGGDDVQFTVKADIQKSPQKLATPIPFVIGNDALAISSLASSSSPNITQCRVNAMAGLVGADVRSDRRASPDAFHLVRPDGLQWYDMVSTSFRSWRGGTTLADPFRGESGHRLVVHSAGIGSPHGVEVTVKSTLPKIPMTTYLVLINTTTGGTNLFGPNFIGFDYGANRVFESKLDASTCKWIAKGDDLIFDNGQLYTKVHVDYWYRFGATISISINNANDFELIKEHYRNGLGGIDITMTRGGTNIGSMSIDPQAASLAITLIPATMTNSVLVYLTSGQEKIPYEIEVAEDPTGPWAKFGPRSQFFVGDISDDEGHRIPVKARKEFYRATFLR